MINSQMPVPINKSATGRERAILPPDRARGRLMVGVEINQSVGTDQSVRYSG